MAIQNRRGDPLDLDESRLLPGEYAICSDGTIVICYAAGKTKRLASGQDFTDFANEYDIELEYLKKKLNTIVVGGSPMTVATKEEALTGKSDDTLMTPLKVALTIGNIKLPIATKKDLGAVKVGDGLGIRNDGDLFAESKVIESMTNAEIDAICK